MAALEAGCSWTRRRVLKNSERDRNPSDPSVGDAKSLPDIYMATNVPVKFRAKSMGKV
jgi:hypothetical protein